MHIDLPQDIIERLRLRAVEGRGLTEVDVIRQALDSLDWQEAERVAIQEGINAMLQGRVRDFDDFDQDFRASCGIPALP